MGLISFLLGKKQEAVPLPGSPKARTLVDEAREAFRNALGSLNADKYKDKDSFDLSLCRVAKSENDTYDLLGVKTIRMQTSTTFIVVDVAYDYYREPRFILLYDGMLIGVNVLYFVEREWTNDDAIFCFLSLTEKQKELLLAMAKDLTGETKWKPVSTRS